jgi:WD40 repeat protein
MMPTKPMKSVSEDRRLAEVIAEYLQAVEAGQHPDPEELLLRNPELAAELTEFLALEGQFDRLMSPFRAPFPATQFPASSAVAGPGAEGSAGHRFGDYELIAEIARGGMGVVYRARNVRLDRIVALKMILAGHLATAADLDRFRTEAQSAARLDHPNIVPLYEIGDYAGQPYFAMKLIDGGSLADLSSRYANDPGNAARLLATVARAVHYAHQRGILHRDLKPANILIDESGVPHITDFGLAKRLAGDGGYPSSSALVGTPSYMAPEQASGDRVLTTAIDVHSLGAILYELLTGRSPFRASTAFDTLLQVVQKEPERPGAINPRIDRDLETICLKCLAKEPQRRYGSAEALADDLEHWLAREPIQARRAGAGERLMKWARRRKAAAALAAASTVGIIAFVIALGIKNVEVTRQKYETDRAVEKYKEALHGYQLALEDSRRTSYFQTIALAGPEVTANNVRRADQLLDGCPAELRQWEWGALKRSCHGESASLPCQAEPAAVRFNPDGRLLAVAGGALGEPGFVTIRDAATGRPIRSFRGHDDAITGMAFSPGGDRLATSSRDGTVRLWDSASARDVLALRGHAGGASCVAFSPDGTRIASAGEDRAVKIWDVATGTEYRSLIGQAASVWSVAFSHDGRLVASGGGDGTVGLWDVAKGIQVRALRGHVGIVHGVVFSPDGRVVASVGYDGTARVWNAANGRELVVFRGHSRFVTAAAFSPDGRYVASASVDRTIKLWEVGSGQPVQSLRGHVGAVWGVAFRPDGGRIASVGDDRMVKLWDVPSLALAAGLRADSVPVRKAELSAKGDRLAVLRGESTLEVWDVTRARRTCSIPAGNGRLEQFCLSADGGLIAAACEKDQTPAVRVWAVDGATESSSLKLSGTAIAGLSFRPDGRALAIAEGTDGLLCWDMTSGRDVRLRAGQTVNTTGDVSADSRLHFSPDGARLLAADSGAQDRARRSSTCFDTSTMRELFTIQAATTPLEYSALGNRFVATVIGSDAGDAQVFDAADGREVARLRGHTAAIRALCIHTGWRTDRLVEPRRHGQGLGRGHGPRAVDPRRKRPAAGPPPIWRAWRAAHRGRRRGHGQDLGGKPSRSPDL